jgi:hypothetical protein
MRKNSNDVLNALTDESKQNLANFLFFYNENSHASYKSSIARVLQRARKDNFKDLNFDDYKPIADSIEQSVRKKTGDSYVEYFFKYLFANDIITDHRFGKIWIKDDIVKHFVLSKQDKGIKGKKKKEVLSIEHIMTIQEKMNEDYSRFDMLRKALVWFLLFDTDVGVDELRYVTSKDFSNGILKLKNGRECGIPERFHPVFKALSEKQYDGFSSLPDIVRSIGELVGIDDLIPRTIVNTRNANMLSCSNCHRKHTNLSSNWKSINGRIVCIICAEKIKKKSTFEPLEIKNESVKLQSEEIEIGMSTVLYTFNELKSQIPKMVDYLKLHEFQMKIGKLGEAYVYELEKKYLKDTVYESRIDATKAINEKNGYDILSYDLDGNEVFIEVKTTIKEEADFFISQNELNVAKSCFDKGRLYHVYRVSNVMSELIKVEIIKNIFDSSKYEILPCSNRISFTNK